LCLLGQAHGASRVSLEVLYVLFYGTAANRRTVLVVDHEPEVLRFTTTILYRHALKAQVAQDRVEGPECYHRHRDELCLVITTF
jgi:hypothetical protein